MSIFGHLWSFVVMYVQVHKCLIMVMHGAYGYVLSWSYTMNGKVWSFMVMYGHVQPCMNLYGHVKYSPGNIEKMENKG